MGEAATRNEPPPTKRDAAEAALRVAMVSKSLTRAGGGLTPMIQSLGRALCTDFAIDLEVYGIEDEHVAGELADWAPVTARAFSSYGPKSLSFAPAMTRAVLDFDGDLVHTHGLWAYPSLAALRFTQKTGRPHLVSLHGMLNPIALSHSKWKKQLIGGWLYEHKHLRTAACIHALTKVEAGYARDYGVKAPICVVPNGVEPPPKRPDRPAPWAEHFPAGSKVLLSLGRFNPIKGLPNLIDGWRKAKDATGDDTWRLVLVGWGQHGHEEELREQTKQLGLDDSVCFLGPQFGDDKLAAYAAADAFVLPSLSEAFPMVVLEAWSHGLPVLMTPTCNIPEGFDEGAALRMEANADSIGERLAETFGMPEDDLRAIGERGRRLTAERYSWRQVGAALRSVYGWVAGGGPAPECVRVD
ncbi:MAG: glycosyltransferase [Planctomycetota bacterium]